MFISNTSADSGYQITRSLRFRASASAYLSRTLVVAGNRKMLAQRFRIKLGTLGTLRVISSAGTTSIDRFYLDASDRLCLDVLGTQRLVTAPLRRDPSAWYVDVEFQLDVANAVAASRAKILMDGTELAYTTDGRAAITNTDTNWNNTVIHYIGRDNVGNYFDGYLAEPVGIDGVTSSTYSALDMTTLQRVAVHPSAAYGTNGFYLPFDDITSTTTLGYDKSGNSNNWTPSGISLTAGATYDSMLDVPSGNAWEDGGNGRGNYATLNPLVKSVGTVVFSEANLKAVFDAAWEVSLSSTPLPLSGKYYWEAMPGGTDNMFGLYATSQNSAAGSAYTHAEGTIVYYGANGTKYVNNVNSAYGAIFTGGDVIGVAVDLSGGTVTFYKNNVSQGTLSLAANMIGVPLSAAFMGASSLPCQANFGQRPFAYTPPTGFKALHTGNLPTPSIPKSADHFDVVLATGANIKTTAEALYPSNFFEWIKDRANANNHQLIDTVRGSVAVLQSNTTAAETTYVAPAGSSVGWVWKAGGAAVANTAGTITSQVSANVAAGVSVVTYTGNGVNGASFGHGLGVVPKLIISKSRNNGSGDAGLWPVYHPALAAQQSLLLYSTAAAGAYPTLWISAPTASVVNVGNGSGVNAGAGATYVAYCFAEIPGFSKFGSVTMNSSADGAYFDTGFDTELLIMKRTDVASNWIMIDSTRQTYNVMGPELYPNLTNAEAIVTELDFTAGGIKFRNSALAGTWIIAAWARAPFKFANAR